MKRLSAALLLFAFLPLWASIQYAGGTNVSATITSDGTQQTLISGIEDDLNTAGWTTNSGHHTATIVLTSATTPTANNSISVRLKTTGNNCATVEMMDSSSALKVSQTFFLLPGSAGVVWRVIANRYQFFAFTTGSTPSRQFLMVSCPYIPTFLNAVETGPLGVAIGNGCSDTSANIANSPRTLLEGVGGQGAGSWLGRWSGLVNNNLNDRSGCAGSASNSEWQFIVQIGARSAVSQSIYRWHDSSLFIGEPLIGWGLLNSTDESLVRGQLWDAMLVSDSFAGDTTLSSVDSHNWWAITNSNAGIFSAAASAKGTLFVVTP